MPEFTKVAPKTDIPDGKMKEYKIMGKTIVVANVDGEYLAFDGICTHAFCPLAGGFLDGYTLTCYCHGTQYDVQTGDVLAPPATNPIRIYSVKFAGEDILIEI